MINCWCHCLMHSLQVQLRNGWKFVTLCKIRMWHSSSHRDLASSRRRRGTQVCRHVPSVAQCQVLPTTSSRWRSCHLLQLPAMLHFSWCYLWLWSHSVLTDALKIVRFPMCCSFSLSVSPPPPPPARRIDWVYVLWSVPRHARVLQSVKGKFPHFRWL